VGVVRLTYVFRASKYKAARTESHVLQRHERIIEKFIRMFHFPWSTIYLYFHLMSMLVIWLSKTNTVTS
jgi:hypothetical protein